MSIRPQQERGSFRILQAIGALPAVRNSRVLGVLPGEGIGPEVIGCAMQLLHTIEAIAHIEIETRIGGPIGTEALLSNGKELTPEVITFCEDVFAQGGAILSGPGSGRFVYDLRKSFDLFCKIVPIQPYRELRSAGPIRPRHVDGVDILLVRDNAAGVYQGRWSQRHDENGIAATHTFEYSEADVLRIVRVAAQLAAMRRNRLGVVLKDGGIPTISRLWRDCAQSVAAEYDLQCSFLNIDYACYALIRHATELDVVVTSNLFGDIVGDTAALLLSSRAISFSGNFSATGAAVYQTNHGAAYDLHGLNRANPVGQILSLAMLLRESFGMCREATLIENAVRLVWKRGNRTADVQENSRQAVSTTQMADLICEAVVELSRPDASITTFGLPT